MYQLTFETILLRDNRLKADVNSARFMSSEPASFFAELLVRPLGIYENTFQSSMHGAVAAAAAPAALPHVRAATCLSACVCLH